MKTALIALEKNEIHMLVGLMASMYHASQNAPDKGMCWVIIMQRFKVGEPYFSEEEVDLLKLAAERALSAGEKVLERLPADDVAGRIRAGVVKRTYTTIREKLDVVQYQERKHVNQGPENVSGEDEGRVEG